MWGNDSKQLTSIKVEDPFSDAHLKEYKIWWRENVIPDSEAHLVRAISCDGEEKIGVACGADPNQKRPGGQKADGTTVSRGFGWFMGSCMETGAILDIEEMEEPEGNGVLFRLMKRVLPIYTSTILVQLDRMCQADRTILKSRELLRLFCHVKHLVVDKYHAQGHADSCSCNPWVHDDLWDAQEEFNTSISEQVFSWFRGYTKLLNTMFPNTHRFYVFYYAKLHNFLVMSGDVEHLNEHKVQRPPKTKASRSYNCTTRLR